MVFFFEANHGKGAIDGIGGTLRHAVFRHVLSNKVVIKSPRQFAEYADSILPNISGIFVDDGILQLDYYEECRENFLNFKNLKKTLWPLFMDGV